MPANENGISLGDYRAYLESTYAPVIDGISVFMDTLQRQAGNIEAQFAATGDFMAEYAEGRVQAAHDAAIAAHALDPQFPHAAEVFNRMRESAQER